MELAGAGFVEGLVQVALAPGKMTARKARVQAAVIIALETKLRGDLHDDVMFPMYEDALKATPETRIEWIKYAQAELRRPDRLRPPARREQEAIQW